MSGSVVHSFHISVRIGDGAIHLLLDDDEKTVCGAVLIDGGDTATIPSKFKTTPDTVRIESHPLTRTMDWINKSGGYDFGTKKELKFDAIILTHWDADHFTGITNILKAAAADARGPGQIPWIKWSDQGKAETHFYCPSDKVNKGDNFEIERTADPPTIGIKYKKPGEPEATYEFARYHEANRDSSLWEVLGVEFFSNQGLKSQDHRKLTPSELIQAHGGLKAGLYCVGVSQKSFVNPTGPLPPGIIGPDSNSSENRSSISAMVMSPGAQNEPPRVSHYFAGDLDDVREEEILKWLDTEDEKTKKIESVTSIKINHHGAPKSTPLRLFDRLQPKNTFIPTPINAEYGHPNCGIIFLWCAWAESVSRAGGLFAATYPAALTEEAGKWYPTKYVTTVFKNKKFKEQLNAADNAVNRKLEKASKLYFKNLMSEYDGRPDKENFLLGKFATVWQQHGFPTPDYHREGYAAYWNQLPTPTDKALMFVRIKCLLEGDEEGKVDYLNIDKKGLEALPSPNMTCLNRSSNLPVGLKKPTSVKRTQPFGLVSPPVRRRKNHYSQLGADDDRETDDLLLGHVQVAEGSCYMPDETNPNEMDDPDDESEEDDDEETVDAKDNDGEKPEPTDSMIQSVAGEPLASDEDGWCIYTNDLTEYEIEANGVKDFERLPVGVLSDFVADLRCRVLWLKSRPPSQVESIVPLHMYDEWCCYFNDVLNAKEFAVMTDKQGKVSGFETQVSLEPFGNGPTSATSTCLHFTTDPVVLKTAFGSTDPVLPTGLLKEHCLLVLGLSPVKTSQPVYLHDLLNFVGLENLQNNPLLAILGAIPIQPPSSSDALKNKRNAVWFLPSNDYRTTVRLEWEMEKVAQEALNGLIEPLKLTVGSTWAIARRTSYWKTSGDLCHALSSGNLVFRTELVIGKVKLRAIFEFREYGTTLVLTLDSKSTEALQSILDWVQGLLPERLTFDFTDLQNRQFGTSSLGVFYLRRITLELVKDNMQAKAKLSTFRIDMEASVIHPPQDPTLFLLSYVYEKGNGSTVYAKLWCAPPPFPAVNEWRLLPDYEEYPALTPISIDVSQWKHSLDLAALVGFEDVPAFLPTEVLTAELTATKDWIAFGGTLKPKIPTGKLPAFSIAEVSLDASYQWGASSGKSFTGGFAIKALLRQPEGARFGWPAQLVGSILYSSDPAQWVLSGTVSDLYASTLAQFFDKDKAVQDAVTPILDSIGVEYLDITYTYAKRLASSIEITGILRIASLRFTLNFNHDGTGWTFSAQARRTENLDVGSTVGDLVTNMAGEDMCLPDFISNIGVHTNEGNTIELVLKETIPDSSGVPHSMVVLLTVQLGVFTFRYIQFREVVSQEVFATTPTERVLIASVNTLPGSEIPLVGNVGQPFDEVLFMWVQPHDKSHKPNGLTKRQLDIANKVLDLLGQRQLPYKAVKEGTPAPDDVLLLQGMHFMLMRHAAQGPATVALDYAFNRPKEPQALVDNGVEDKGSRLAPYERNEGPLSIKNIGLKYSTGISGKESILSIRLDAFAKVGPVEFAVLGLSLGLNFAGSSTEGKPYTLNNLPAPAVSLDGLQAAFDQPPIEIAGMLLFENNPAGKSFTGALTVSYIPWRFQAAGYYGEIQKGNGEYFTSFFLYCVLNGPLITFEFASIEGVCGGFGYNSSLTFPTPQNVQKFPLISGGTTTPGDSGPRQIMEQLVQTPWFFPRQGSFWVAAGLTVKAFEILVVQAVLVIQWDPQVDIGIFGMATASIPGGQSTTKFAHVELGITATLSLHTGVLKVEGELTPASFILDPNCHLLGGFAFYSWFDSHDDASVKGDWVFTIGGFHPRYNKPPQYPNPPRLGISWQFGKAISISGQAYFAITPKACMGGGRLDVALSLNPLFAYFNAFVDFLINFKPFSFIAEGGLTVGVRFTLDLWLVCINIKVEIGARLYIQGPPVCGRVHVDFWVFGFDIDFGPKGQQAPDALSLDEFINLVCQTHASGMPSLGLTTHREPDLKDPEAHVFSVQEGLIPKDAVESTPSGGEMWVVRASTFEFSVNCKVAIQNATVVTVTMTGKEYDHVDGTGKDIFAKPMRTTAPINSTLTVTIQAENHSLNGFYTEPVWNRNQSIVKAVPLALWGKYDRSSDPSYQKNPSNMLNGKADKAVDLMMGVQLSSPLPLPSDDTTVPFNVEKFQIEKMQADSPIALPSDPTPSFLPIPSTSTQYADVEAAWSRDEEAAKQTVDLWETFGLAKLGWSQKKIDSPAGKLTGSIPRRIVDNLAQYYLWPPMLSGL